MIWEMEHLCCKMVIIGFMAAKKAGLKKFPIQKVLSYDISVENGIIDLPRGIEPKEY